MAIFSKGLSGISVIWPCLFPFTQCTISNVFADVLIHAIPVLLMFDEMIGSVYSLAS